MERQNPQYWETVDILEKTRQQKAFRNVAYETMRLRERDPTIPGTKAWRDMMALKPRYLRR